MGGKPSKSTPADMRLKRNNPHAGKPKPPAPTSAVQPTAMLPVMMPGRPAPPVPPKKAGK